VEFTDWVSFSVALILLLAEIYGILIFMIGNFVNVGPITRHPVPLPEADQLPTVDVFVPSYNENKSILEVTLVAGLQMRYPPDKLKVYLCDDGGTDQKCETGSLESRQAAKQRQQELM
jgi:cellulose synthase (UDP-forming)